MNTATLTTVEQVKAIVAEATQAAYDAAVKYQTLHGDSACCGFAWVNIHGIKGNTKLGKLLKAAGMEQDWTRAFSIWNPSGLGTQSIDVKEAGAEAAADVFRKYGFEQAYAGSRMD
jgi:hypothetical protein